MGSDQSKSSPEPSRSSRYTERHYSQEEVQRVLDLQKMQLEQEMNILIQQQTARETTSPSNIPERQRTPYNYSYTANTAGTSSNLYPTLPNGNPFTQGATNMQNNFVNNNMHRNQPSAPPPEPQASARTMFQAPEPRQRAESEDVACPTCNFRYTERIFNCLSGHASCAVCQNDQRRCGKCAQTITDRRNITMEEYVSQKKSPCPNADEGCTLHFKQCDVATHLKECPFGEVQCVLPGGKCQWKGKLSRLSAHFDQFHSAYKTEVDTENFLELNNIYKTIRLVKIGNYNFILHLNASTDKINTAVQLLGTKASAAKWNYEVHVYNKSDSRRKFFYMDKCMSKGESFDSAVNTNDCAVLPMQYAKSFANSNGSVAYRIYIKKVMERERRDESCSRERERDVSSSRPWRGRGRGRGRGARGGK